MFQVAEVASAETSCIIAVRSSGAIHRPLLKAVKCAVNLITIGGLRRPLFVRKVEPTLCSLETALVRKGTPFLLSNCRWEA